MIFRLTPRTYRSFAITPVLFCAIVSPVQAMQPDAQRGREVFKQCEGCHSMEADVHLYGPSLHGVVNRPAGKLESYDYSDALGAVDFQWTSGHLQQWLQDEPKNMVPGTRMEFPGLPDKQNIDDLIKFLESPQ